jgi:hypothetical protein
METHYVYPPALNDVRDLLSSEEVKKQVHDALKQVAQKFYKRTLALRDKSPTSSVPKKLIKRVHGTLDINLPVDTSQATILATSDRRQLRSAILSLYPELIEMGLTRMYINANNADSKHTDYKTSNVDAPGFYIYEVKQGSAVYTPSEPVSIDIWGSMNKQITDADRKYMEGLLEKNPRK